MADDENAGEGAPATEGTDDDLTFVDFDVRMTEVQRVEPDAESDDLDDLFTVSISLDAANVNGTMEVMVTDAADVEVVAVALDTLHGALTAWAELIQRRREAARAEAAEIARAAGG